MSKKVIIVGVFIVLIFIGVIVFSLSLTDSSFKPSNTKQPSPELQTKSLPEKGSLALTGWILEIDEDRNILTIKSERDGNAFKGFVDDEASVFKIDLPEELPKEKTSIILPANKIDLVDFQEGDYVYVFVREKPASLNEPPTINLIRFYPFVAGFTSDFFTEEEEIMEPCKEYPEWNMTERCYMKPRWVASNHEYHELGLREGTGFLTGCFYQVRSKVNGNYEGPEVWQSADCAGKFYHTEERVVIDVGPEGNCYARGEQACQVAGIVVNSVDLQQIGFRQYNIGL